MRRCGGRFERPTSPAIRRSRTATTTTPPGAGSSRSPAPCNPGAYDSEERDVFFEAEDRRLVETALADLGYRLIDEPETWEPYDGVNTALRPEITWGGRFFDYL
ncbi:hypothetical protein QRX50_05240 [Amycolatopsis carbonis]|uniref:Uncharacterized protein n=1 Tax=Amycolatopsis carbonis TaxID=715471 RepID=A0A9Y2IIS2_9PSEU|nr:hypothetical protein [Amycolatopsis sp. 2-15]WIX80194.1 hypothetical protein QRX50_05240 [Amycolatopsis sp. 2-15]